MAEARMGNEPLIAADGEGSDKRAPRPLAYQPNPRRRFPRWLARVLTLLVALVAIAAVVYQWGPPYYRQAIYLYWQHKAMNWSPPADMVVYEEEPDRASALLRSGGGYWPPGGDTGDPVAAHVPPPLAELHTVRVPVVFLHRRMTPSGEERLTVLVLHVSAGAEERRVAQIHGRGGVPATWTPGSTWERHYLVRGGLFVALDRADRLRIFAGQPDRADATRFTVHYELNRERGFIEGTLKDDGSLLLIPHGPLVPRLLEVPPWH